jgi:hypothetical protein
MDERFGQHPRVSSDPGGFLMRPVPLLCNVAACGLLAVVLQPATPALAQMAGGCGQPVASTQVFADPLSEGFEPLRSFVEIRRSEPRYVEFVLDAQQPVTLRTDAPDTDPMIALYDERGGLVTWDDDSGGALQALIAEQLPAGRYCAQIRPAGAAPVDFSVAVLVIESGLRFAPGTGTPCADPATVRDLALSLARPVSPVALDAATDAGTGFGDFRMSLSESLGLRIDAASAEFDTYLTVLDTAGNIVAENDDFSGLDSRIEQAFPAGDYCVSVRAVGGGGGGFSVALSEADIVPPAMPCGDPARVAALAAGFGPGAPATAQRGALDPASGESWFGFSVGEQVEVRLDAASTEFDTMVDLHDMNGGFLASNDDGPDGGTDSRIETALAPGDYCITVRSFDGTAGAFDLTLAAAGAPAIPGPLDPAQATAIEDMGVLDDEVRSYTISSDPALWTAFTVTTTGPVTVQGVSVSSAFSITLFAEDGTELAAAGPVEPMSAATVSAELPPGRYLVALVNEGAMGTILRQVTVTRD